MCTDKIHGAVIGRETNTMVGDLKAKWMALF